MHEDASGTETGHTGRRALPALMTRLGDPENVTHRGEILREIYAALEAAAEEGGAGPSTAEMAARIQGWIDELDVSHPGAFPTRICKEELNALPIHADIIYIWAVRPDGEILSLDHEAFSLTREVETSSLIRFGAMVRGAQQYPQLWELIPSPPAGVQPCESCDGTGVPIPSDAAHSYCFGCNGLGWISRGQGTGDSGQQ